MHSYQHSSKLVIVYIIHWVSASSTYNIARAEFKLARVLMGKRTVRPKATLCILIVLILHSCVLALPPLNIPYANHQVRRLGCVVSSQGLIISKALHARGKIGIYDRHSVTKILNDRRIQRQIHPYRDALLTNTDRQRHQNMVPPHAAPPALRRGPVSTRPRRLGPASLSHNHSCALAFALALALTLAKRSS